MDHLYEIADFDRHDLKMDWVFVRAVPGEEPEPPAATPNPSPAKTEPAA